MELLVIQPQLNPWKGNGAPHSRGHLNHRRNKKFIQLTNIIIFYKETTNWMDEGRAVDIVYLDFSKASGCLSCSSHRQIQEVWVGGVNRDVGGVNRVNGEIHWLRTV